MPRKAQHTVLTAHTFDNEVFVDHVIPLVADGEGVVEAYGIPDLAGAELSASLGFLFIRSLHWLDEENWPSIHNLHLLFGPQADTALIPLEAELGAQVIEDNPEVPVAGQGKSIRLKVRCNLSDPISDQLIKIDDFIGDPR